MADDLGSAARDGVSAASTLAAFAPWGALAGGAIGAGAGWLFGSQANEAKKKAAL